MKLLLIFLLPLSANAQNYYQPRNYVHTNAYGSIKEPEPVYGTTSGQRDMSTRVRGYNEPVRDPRRNTPGYGSNY